MNDDNKNNILKNINDPKTDNSKTDVDNRAITEPNFDRDQSQKDTRLSKSDQKIIRQFCSKGPPVEARVCYKIADHISNPIGKAFFNLMGISKDNLSFTDKLKMIDEKVIQNSDLLKGMADSIAKILPDSVKGGFEKFSQAIDKIEHVSRMNLIDVFKTSFDTSDTKSDIAKDNNENKIEVNNDKIETEPATDVVNSDTVNSEVEAQPANIEPTTGQTGELPEQDPVIKDTEPTNTEEIADADKADQGDIETDPVDTASSGEIGVEDLDRTQDVQPQEAVPEEVTPEVVPGVTVKEDVDEKKPQDETDLAQEKGKEVVEDANNFDIMDNQLDQSGDAANEAIENAKGDPNDTSIDDNTDTDIPAEDIPVTDNGEPKDPSTAADADGDGLSNDIEADADVEEPGNIKDISIEDANSLNPDNGAVDINTENIEPTESIGAEAADIPDESLADESTSELKEDVDSPSVGTAPEETTHETATTDNDSAVQASGHTDTADIHTDPTDIKDLYEDPAAQNLSAEQADPDTEIPKDNPISGPAELDTGVDPSFGNSGPMSFDQGIGAAPTDTDMFSTANIGASTDIAENDFDKLIDNAPTDSVYQATDNVDPTTTPDEVGQNIFDTPKDIENNPFDNQDFTDKGQQAEQQTDMPMDYYEAEGAEAIEEEAAAALL